MSDPCGPPIDVRRAERPGEAAARPRPQRPGAAPLVAFACTGAAAIVLATLAGSGGGGRGALTVESVPAGASVFLDGEFRGLTPCDIAPLGPGQHSLRLEKAGFETWVQRIEFREGLRLPPARLEPAPVGAIDLRSRPSGAEVFLDGQFRGVTPLVLGGVPAGPHALRVEKTNHGPKAMTVLVRAGETASVSCELEDRMLEYLKNAVVEFPDEPYRYMELGHYYFLSGEPELAAETYGRGLALAQGAEGDKAQREKLERQIRKDMSQGGPTGERFKSHMERIMRDLRSQLPAKVSAALRESRERERAGRAEEAVELLERALREAPDSAALREELARLRLSLGGGEAALSALREAFRRAGADHAVRQRLAEAALQAHDRFDEASRREIFRLCADELARTRAAAAPEEMAASWRLQHRLELGSGRSNEAAAALAAAAGLERDALQRARMELELGRLYASLGRIDEARRVLQKVATSAGEPSLRESARAEMERLAGGRPRE